ncbi:hypothetical protein GGF38_002111, partial [Coemansia sp. RSA 25]
MCLFIKRPEITTKPQDANSIQGNKRKPLVILNHHRLLLLAAATTATTFVARNAVWDPFIVWIVNTQLAQPEIDAFNARIADNPTPIPGYPTPPTFALHP